MCSLNVGTWRRNKTRTFQGFNWSIFGPGPALTRHKLTSVRLHISGDQSATGLTLLIDFTTLNYGILIPSYRTDTLAFAWHVMVIVAEPFEFFNAISSSLWHRFGRTVTALQLCLWTHLPGHVISAAPPLSLYSPVSSHVVTTTATASFGKQCNVFRVEPNHDRAPMYF